MLLKKIVVQHVATGAKPSQENAQKRPQLFVACPIMLHDNARPDIADVLTKKLRYYGWEELHHEPYCPDMSPPDSDLFPKLKEPIRGRRFLLWKNFLPTVPRLFDT